MKKALIVVLLMLLLLLTANVDTPHNAAVPERNINDPNMPRQQGFVGMEVADAEYLYLRDQSALKKKETAAENLSSEPPEVVMEEVVQEPSKEDRQQDVAVESPAAGGTESLPIGIHSEDIVQKGHLTASLGVFNGPSGREKWYNLDMGGVVDIMRHMGYDEVFYPYWIREDGVKMLGDYVMVAANVSVRPKGTVLETSLGRALVCDACAEANGEPTLLDIAVSW